MIRRFAIARHPMVEDYGFLIRFLVLFTVWGTIAYTFRLYYNLTWLGLIQSGLFFITSVMVFAGLWTRSAMFGLGLVVLLQTYLLHKSWAIGVAVLPLISALLPLGGFYSLDRYFQLHRRARSYVPTGPAPESIKVGTGLRVLFVALVAFIIGGPAYNEIFHNHSKLFRSWDMYHVIGRDMVVLEFFRPIAGGGRQHVDYIQALGHTRKGSGLVANSHIMMDMRIIGTDALDGVIGRTCAAVDDPASLRLDAKIATLKHGWLPLFRGNEAICDASGKPLLKSAQFNDEHEKDEEGIDAG